MELSHACQYSCSIRTLLRLVICCGRSGIVSILLGVVPIAAAEVVVPTASVYVTKSTRSRQRTTNSLVSEFASFDVVATVTGIVLPIDAKIELQGRGKTIRLLQVSPPSLQFQANFNYANETALDEAIPDGSYTLVVGNTAFPQVNITSNVGITQVQVQNFDSLQRLISPISFSATFAPIPEALFRGMITLRENVPDHVQTPIQTGDILFGASKTISVGSLPPLAIGQSLEMRAKFSETRWSPSATLSVQSMRVHNLVFPITRSHPPPVITQSPLGQTVSDGGIISLSLSASGAELRFQWLRNGQPLAGQTRSTLVVPGARLGHSGAYHVVVANSGGEVSSRAVDVFVLPPPPIVSIDPPNGIVGAGATVTLSSAPLGDSNFYYVWRRNGVAFGREPGPSVTFAPARVSHSGSYTLELVSSFGSVASQPVSLAVLPVTRISNLSVRAQHVAARGPLAVGFAVNGTGSFRNAFFLLRAVGPSLAPFGIANFLSDPRLALLTGQSILAQNDDWGGSQIVAEIGASVGAFPLSGGGSKDSLLLRDFEPGSYSALIDGAGATSGVVLTELYDTASDDFLVSTTPRLSNLSVLSRTGGESGTLIAGFSISGVRPLRVLVRGVGLTLRDFQVPDALSDPRIDLFRADAGVPIFSNDDWVATPASERLADAAVAVGAFPLSPAGKDSALLVSLVPGSYSVHISGNNGASGNVLIEIYEAP